MPNLNDKVHINGVNDAQYQVYHITGSGKGTPVSDNDRVVFLRLVKASFWYWTPPQYIDLPYVKFDELTRPVLRG